MKKDFKKLIQLRLENHYSCQDMADKLNICKSFYWQIEHNNRRFQYKMACAIAAIFELKPDDLFYEETL